VRPVNQRADAKSLGYEHNLVVKNVDVSVFVPINNEEESIPILYRELTEVLTALGREFEIIAVDDGSTDSSLEVLTSVRPYRP